MNWLSKEQIPSLFEIPSSGRLLLAFSGGSDSLCLMYLLSIVAKDRCEALYINHHIRSDKELELEISLNKRNAELLGIKLSVVDLEKGSVDSYSKLRHCGIEAACRALRYKALEEYAKNNNFDYILTAHHREDQVETVLMRMLSGSPFYTYQGILYREGMIIRPLLYLSKNTINSIISYSGLHFSEDSTNTDIKYRRNAIRHSILPMLSDSERDLISQIASNVAAYRKRHDSIDINVFNHYVLIKRDDLLSALKENFESAVFSASSAMDNPDRLSRKFLDEILSMVQKGRGKASTSYLDFIVDKNYLRIYRRYEDFLIDYEEGVNDVGPFLISHDSVSSKDLSIDTTLFVGKARLRKSKLEDKIVLKEGTKKVRELEKRAHAPFSIVLEDDEGIVAVFLRFLGGNDRLSSRFISHFGKTFIIL